MINNSISEVLIIVGKNVKKYRLERKFTQQKLAYLCEPMDKSTISNVECGRLNGLNISTIIKISLALEIEIYQLFEK